MIGPEEVLAFWLDELKPEQWYKQDDAMDAEIRARFQTTWQSAMEGRFSLWLTYPTGALAYILVTDQFSRNMFRDTPKAFASDRIALAAAKSAIDRGWDLKIDEPARQFFYLPMMHSENLSDQDRCIRLICERMPETGFRNLPHAKVHREIIRKYGRFPYRNETLSRRTTAAEAAFLHEGGYGATLRRLEGELAS